MEGGHHYTVLSGKASLTGDKWAENWGEGLACKEERPRQRDKQMAKAQRWECSVISRTARCVAE